MSDDTEPIDVTLVAVRKRIEQARRAAAHEPLLPGVAVTWHKQLLRELADEAERLADYVGQPDPYRLNEQQRKDLAATLAAQSVAHQLPASLGPLVDRLCQPITDGEVPDHDDLLFTFSMQAVVDRVLEIAPDVVAYVEQTGGGCATIYAAKRRDDRAGGSGNDQAVLYQAPGEPGWGRWPVMGGPGSFDWHGTDHVASLDEFYVGPDTELMEAPAGPPFPPPPGEYTAAREDTVESLAERVVQVVREFVPTLPGVIVWPGR
jgi:hypothetical protein